MAVSEAQVRAYLEPEEPNYQAAAGLGPDALPVLERLVRDADPLLASKAAYLASLIPDDRADRVLEVAARSEHATVRVAAAAGLEKRPEPPEDAVVDLMSDRDEGVRKVAMRATKRMSREMRDRLAARASSERDVSGGGAPAARDAAPGEGGEGEGGGDLGTGDRGRVSSASQDSESGGGGDLGKGAERSSSSAADGPDGGGSVDSHPSQSPRDDELSQYGGGSY
jgi:hypothetical protein